MPVDWWDMVEKKGENGEWWLFVGKQKIISILRTLGVVDYTTAMNYIMAMEEDECDYNVSGDHPLGRGRLTKK